MADREERILAAAEEIEVNGVVYKLRPVVAQHLCDLEREALRHYKQQYLQTFKENADLLGNNSREFLEKKLNEVARWDLEDLPKKMAYDASRVPITKRAKEWIKGAYGEVPKTDEGIRRVLSSALDDDQITADQVKEMTGKTPLCGRIRYDQWWITASWEGMISIVLSSIRWEHPEITKEDIAGWPLLKVTEASRIVESISSAAMGNT